MKYKTRQRIKLLVFATSGVWLWNILGGAKGLIQVLLMVGLMIGQFALIFWFMARYGTYEIVLPGEVDTKWTDVFGQDKLVARMKQMQIYLESPERIEDRGGYVPKGVVLYGPPGVGKTLMAKAFASETKFPFVLVPPGGFTAMFMGVNFMKVAKLFRVLKKLDDKHGGVICFMDEIDNLGSRGGQVNGGDQDTPKMRDWFKLNPVVVGGGMGGGNMGTLPMLLSKMDGLDKNAGLWYRLTKMFGMKPPPIKRRRILFFGATNMLQNLDQALLRDGRFDRKLYVGYPDLEGRIATFNGYLAKIAHNISDDQVLALAKRNPQASGAFIRGIINEGLINAIENGRDAMSWTDMRDAIIWKQMGEDRGRQQYEEDQRRVAIHEAAHAVAAHYFRKTDRIDFASVVMRGRTLGVVSSVPLEERHTQTKSEIEGDIKVALASHWAESEWYDGDLSSGPSSDLNTANRLADLYIHSWAMGVTLNVVLENEVEVLADWLYDTREEFLVAQYNELSEFLSERKDQIEAIAALLDKYDTVDGEEIHRILTTMELEKR